MNTSALNLTLFSRNLTLAASILSVSLGCTLAHAEEIQTQEARFSTGLSLGTAGLGITTSSTTQWHLTEDDQIQWRVMASGINANLDSDDDFDFEGIDYKEANVSMFALQGGVDWFPYRTGWADKVFFSTGLIYSSNDLDADADMGKDFYVGSTFVNAGDVTSLTMEIDNQQVMPYVSVGWGNKITGERGFDFQIELAVAAQTRDADIKLTAVDPASILSAADLNDEKKEIENEVSGPIAFGTATVSYHF